MIRERIRHHVRLSLAIMLAASGVLGTWLGVAVSSAQVTSNDAIWPNLELQLYAGGLSQPVHITHADDDSERLFVVEQVGRIRIVKDGILLATPFLDISNLVVFGGERGLLSIAFPPDYASVGHFYVNYTRVSDGATVVARYSVTADPDLADPNSKEVILTIGQPYGNHNGGQLAFSPSDGYLYIGTGDGGSGGDPHNYAQNPGSPLGKMLRIDVESGTTPYAIPPSNPYTQTATYLGEIWALGLRNPWRFSFDRETGDLYIADVGQDIYEEIDYQPLSSDGGENYGWRVMEGFHCYDAPACDMTGLTLPVHEYDHAQGCSVTGGAVYRGQQYPRIRGVYVYGDYCNGRIWGLRRAGNLWTNVLLYDADFRIATFGEDQGGNLYVADYDSGRILRLVDPERVYLPVVSQP